MTAPRDSPDFFAIDEIALRSFASRFTESVIAASSDGLFFGLTFFAMLFPALRRALPFELLRAFRVVMPRSVTPGVCMNTHIVVVITSILHGFESYAMGGAAPFNVNVFEIINTQERFG